MTEIVLTMVYDKLGYRSPQNYTPAGSLNVTGFFDIVLVVTFSKVNCLMCFSLGPDKKGHQFSCVCLHGDRKPHERKQNLERFKVLILS